jgi:plasmid stabilization system protein ParE
MGTTVSKRPGVRRIVHWPYAVYYEIDAAAYVVTILHIWHGKRDSE